MVQLNTHTNALEWSFSAGVDVLYFFCRLVAELQVNGSTPGSAVMKRDAMDSRLATDILHLL